MMNKILTVAMLGALSATSAQALSKADVEAIVAKYIANNGEEIAKSMDTFLREESVRKANEIVHDYNPTAGYEDAPVTFIEFSDYRCGYCKRAQDTLQDLREKYKGQVRFVYKQLPILSQESFDAAVASYAAREQGKFWEYNARLWANQGRISDGDKLFRKLAKELKLDLDKFDADRESKEIQGQVIADAKEARERDLSATPSFIIHGEIAQGALPMDAFEGLIDAALEDVKNRK